MSNPFLTAWMCLAIACSQASASAAELPVGLVAQEPDSSPFVKTERGYMVPYKTKIPGTEVEYEMVPVPGAKYLMGSPDSETGRKVNEGPQVEITVEPFWIGKFEVTWAEYKKFMSMYNVFKSFHEKKTRAVNKENEVDAISCPSQLYDPTYTFDKGEHPRLPAVSMSQFAAKQYTKWLSLMSGRVYRLPTEAEWEYACRAGSKSAYCFGDDPKQLDGYAWTSANSNDTPHKVGEKKPNAWGLYDMHGNVAEWCLDQLLEDSYQKWAGKNLNTTEAVAWPTKLYPRVVRGGTWEDDPSLARSAARTGSNDREWTDTDPNLPKSPWWFTDGMALSLGMRIVRPLASPARAACAKFWDADLDSIRDAAAARMNQGRGALGLVDQDLPNLLPGQPGAKK